MKKKQKEKEAAKKVARAIDGSDTSSVVNPAGDGLKQRKKTKKREKSTSPPRAR